jgi:hypothetical protein
MKNHFKLEACVMVLLPVLIIAVAVAAALIVSHAAGPITPPGQITFSYNGKSDSKYFFLLDNRSAQAIYLRGTKGFWTDLVPWHTTTCQGGASALTESDNSILGDSISRISPGQRLRVAIGKDELVMRHIGGHCSVQLHSENQDHVSIKSNEFEP